MRRIALFVYILFLSFFFFPSNSSANCVLPDRLEYVSDTFLGHTIAGTLSIEKDQSVISGARLLLTVSGPIKNASYEYVSKAGLARDNTLISRSFQIRTTRGGRTEVKDFSPSTGEGDPLTVALNLMGWRYGAMNPGGTKSIPVVPLRNRDVLSREVRIVMGTEDDALWYRARDNPGEKDSVFIVTLPAGLYGDIVREVRVWLNECGIPTVAVVEFVTLRLRPASTRDGSTRGWN